MPTALSCWRFSSSVELHSQDFHAVDLISLLNKESGIANITGLSIVDLHSKFNDNIGAGNSWALGGLDRSSASPTSYYSLTGSLVSSIGSDVPPYSQAQLAVMEEARISPRALLVRINRLELTDIGTVKAPNFGPHGNFGPLFQKGLLLFKSVLQKNDENKSSRKTLDLQIRFC
jgi:hypothetical protein